MKALPIFLFGVLNMQVVLLYKCLLAQGNKKFLADILYRVGNRLLDMYIQSSRLIFQKVIHGQLNGRLSNFPLRKIEFLRIKIFFYQG